MRMKNELLASIAGLALGLAALPSVSRAAIVEMIVHGSCRNADTDLTAMRGDLTSK
jgi:hypothetical protein